MPELPETELVRRKLEELCPRGSVVTGCYVIRSNGRFFGTPKGSVGEQSIELPLEMRTVRRRGKVLLLEFDSGTVVSRLGMSAVYRKKSCPRDGMTVVRTMLDGRSTYHCPWCQK